MLEDLGVNATIRRRLGTDISAACGQLRREDAETGRTSNTANDERKDQRTMKIAALTDIGSCRQENQDNYCARQLVDGTGWGLVCDGMGGANGGRVASTLATQTMLRYFDHSLRTIENGEEKAFMMRAFDNANRAVYEKATSDPEVLGMGTTGVCALQRGNLAHIVHAGDSRAYLWHGGAIRQLTRDHSMVQQLVDSGRSPANRPPCIRRKI